MEIFPSPVSCSIIHVQTLSPTPADDSVYAIGKIGSLYYAVYIDPLYTERLAEQCEEGGAEEQWENGGPEHLQIAFLDIAKTQTGYPTRELSLAAPESYAQLEWALLKSDVMASPPEVQDNFVLYLVFLTLVTYKDTNSPSFRDMLNKDKATILRAFYEKIYPQADVRRVTHISGFWRLFLVFCGGNHDPYQLRFDPTITNNLEIIASTLGGESCEYDDGNWAIAHHFNLHCSKVFPTAFILDTGLLALHLRRLLKSPKYLAEKYKGCNLLNECHSGVWEVADEDVAVCPMSIHGTFLGRQ